MKHIFEKIFTKQEKQEETTDNKVKMYAIIAFVIISLLLIGGAVYYFVSQKHGQTTTTDIYTQKETPKTQVQQIFMNEAGSEYIYLPVTVTTEKTRKLFDYESAFNAVVQKGSCDTSTIFLLSGAFDTNALYAYKDLQCTKVNDSLVQLNYYLISGLPNLKKTDPNQETSVLDMRSPVYKNITLYKTRDGLVKRGKNYKVEKNIGADVFLVQGDNDEKDLYTITDSKQGDKRDKGLYKFHTLTDAQDAENIQVFSSGKNREVTIPEKKSQLATQLVVDVEKTDFKKIQLGQISCNETGKCKDKLKDVLSKLQVKKDYFGGTITGNISIGKIEKVIVTPEKNTECELDTEAYILKKFDPLSGKFVYNFSRKWNNVCPKTGARFTIQLLSKDKQIYTTTVSVDGYFYEESYKNTLFVKEKSRVESFDIKDLSYDRRITIGGSEFYNADFNYLGYLTNSKIQKYVYEGTIEENFSTVHRTFITNRKIKDAKDFRKNSGSGLEIDESLKKVYQEQLLDGIALENDTVIIKPKFEQEVDSYTFQDMTFSLETYNSLYKKVTSIGLDNLYKKESKFFLQGKDNLMIPVVLESKIGKKYKIDNNRTGDNELYLQQKSNLITPMERGTLMEKIGTIEKQFVYQDTETNCLFVTIPESNDYGTHYDFYSKNLKIQFVDGKDYGDYTFKLAGQANEDTYDMSRSGKCFHQVKEEDLEINDRLAVFGEYAGLPIYSFTNKNDDYLKRRFREQYGVKRGEEQGERYDEFVKTIPVVYWKDPFGRWLRVVNMVYMPQAEKMKPVIYLYPETTQKINVQVKPNGGFKLTIPEYPAEKGWDVVATPDSQISFEGAVYPYLFWEGKALGYEMGKKGFIIENDKEKIQEFLQEKLALLGMNKKEITDFNEYWVEKLSLVQQKYIFITFASKQQQDLDSPLRITPTPDSIIRVFMDYRGTGVKEQIEELEIITPKREGFTVVEWGGAKRW